MPVVYSRHEAWASVYFGHFSSLNIFNLMISFNSRFILETICCISNTKNEQFSGVNNILMS